VKNAKSDIETIQTRAELLPEDFNFNFSPVLTRELDGITGDFDQNIINKIALWKVARYPHVDEITIERLNGIAGDQEYNEGHKKILCLLLRCRGVRLPMASTFLRFRNPKLFQIIDQRVYRVLTGQELQLPLGCSLGALEETCEMYFDYLRKLKGKCSELDIPFEKADRILWNADKRMNKGKKLKY
jgi:hypothetical protein